MGRAFWFFVDPVKELHQQKIREKGDLTIEVSSVILRYAILANRHVSIIKYPPPCGEDVWSKEKIWFSKTHGTRLGGFQLICCHHWSFNNLSTKTQNHKCIGTSRFFFSGQSGKNCGNPLGVGEKFPPCGNFRDPNSQVGVRWPPSRKRGWKFGHEFFITWAVLQLFWTKNKQKSILFFSTRW